MKAPYLLIPALLALGSFTVADEAAAPTKAVMTADEDISADQDFDEAAIPTPDNAPHIAPATPAAPATPVAPATPKATAEAEAPAATPTTTTSEEPKKPTTETAQAAAPMKKDDKSGCKK